MTKMIGHGTLFQMSTAAASTVFTGVGSIMAVGGPDASADDIDMSTLTSTHNYKEFRRGLVDGGEVSLTLAAQSTGSYTKMKSAFADGANRAFRVIPESTANPAESFEGYVKGMGRTIERAMILKTFAIKVSGDPGIA